MTVDMEGRAFGYCRSLSHKSRGHTLFSSCTVSDHDCDSQADDMDKDNRDDFTFAKLSDLKVPVTLRMSAVFVESIARNGTQGLRTVHSSKDPGFLALSPNSWRNRS